MGKRPKKKIVVILVEGESDRDALNDSISRLYGQKDPQIEVFFQSMRSEDEEKEDGGDITTAHYVDDSGKGHWVNPNNIRYAIYELFLKDFFDEYKLYPKDLFEIIQIVDLDGAYIPDGNVVLDDTLSDKKSPYYTEHQISCVNVEKIQKRNKQKRENLDYLSSQPTIKVCQKTIKYSIYYFSSNLDHFLHNEANLDHWQKVHAAQAFSSGIDGKTDEFIKFFSEDPASAHDMDYDKSWAFAKEGINSIQRHTNINILIDRIINMKVE